MKNYSRKLILFSLIAIFLFQMIPTYAANTQGSVIVPLWDYVDIVYLDLTFDGNIAVCYGHVVPKAAYKVKISVSLYIREEDSWRLLKSWSNSGTGPLTIHAGGNLSVGRGIYKTILFADIGGLELITKSVVKTKQL